MKSCSGASFGPILRLHTLHGLPPFPEAFVPISVSVSHNVSVTKVKFESERQT